MYIVKRPRQFPFHTFTGNGWTLSACVIAAIAIVPVLVVLASAFTPEHSEIWTHLSQTVLPELLSNTAKLIVGVGIGTFVLGTLLGWLTGCCSFPGSKFFSVALILPMAVPAYVFAFIFLGIMDFTGPVQGILRHTFGFPFMDVRTSAGVSFVLTLALYPYVYLMARTGFRTQGQQALEAARTLGYSPAKAFWRVALPMCRPWLAAGMMLVFMETLADFGAVSIFNYDTFTTAIYKAWFGMFSLKTAAQLASVLVFIVIAVLVGEQYMRARLRYTQGGQHISVIHLQGGQAFAATALCSLIFLLAFVIPCIQLIIWILESADAELGIRYLGYTYTTLMLGTGAAILTCLGAVILSYAKRRSPSTGIIWTARLATMGYALPGTVLAVGVFLPTAWADNALIAFSDHFLGINPGPVLQGTVIIMLLAYMVRFMAAGYGAVESSMQRITPSIDEAARLMGVRGFSLLKKIHIPMLRPGLLTGMVLVLVDVMKEMPITLMTRPFGWDTLAVKIYELTSEGEWERAALPALGLIITGVVPVLLLTRQNDKTQE